MFKLNSKYSAMICCLWTRVHKQPIIALYFEFKNELKFYNLGARSNYWHNSDFIIAFKMVFNYSIIYFINNWFSYLYGLILYISSQHIFSHVGTCLSGLNQF